MRMFLCYGMEVLGGWEGVKTLRGMDKDEDFEGMDRDGDFEGMNKDEDIEEIDKAKDMEMNSVYPSPLPRSSRRPAPTVPVLNVFSSTSHAVFFHRVL